MQDIFKSKSSKGRSLRYGEGRTRNGDSIRSITTLHYYGCRKGQRENRDESRVLLCEEEECESAEGFYPTLSPKVRPGP